MSVKPYDFLASDKEPLLYVEKAMVRMSDGMLTLFKPNKVKEIIAPSGTLIMMLGAGTSISQEAAIFCATNDMQIAFSRGGCNIHSFFMSGRYQLPTALVNQVMLSQTKKLEIAKKLFKIRLFKCKAESTKIDSVDNLNSVEELLLYEARWAKEVYAEAARTFQTKFSRDFDGTDSVNERLNILNNSFYSIATAISLSCGLSPSVGFIHGTTRRGGWTFDLVDIYKTSLYFDICFSNIKYTTRHVMQILANRIRDNSQSIIKEMIELSLSIAKNDMQKLDKIYENNRIKSL